MGNAQAAQQRCADKDISVNASVNAHRRVVNAFTNKYGSAHCCAYESINVDNVDGSKNAC